MPITRTYACPECNHMLEVVLSAEQWDDPPPSCPRCDARETQQVFKPPAIGGSARSRAVSIAEEIAANDYKVANIHAEGRPGGTPKVRYKDTTPGVAPSTWTGPNAAEYQLGQSALQTAISLGRETRLKYGSGLDILKHNLETGAQPDLIEQSKKKSPRIW
jgi:putative FmdB family regulatory protein